jgi:hypothetical protein
MLVWELCSDDDQTPVQQSMVTTDTNIIIAKVLLPHDYRHNHSHFFLQRQHELMKISI